MSEEQLVPGTKYPVTGYYTGALKEDRIGRISGYAKERLPLGTVIPITKQHGFAGDEHTKIHGGPERCINHYNENHYARLIKNFPLATATLVAPGFGENITTGTNDNGQELNERNVCIGDVFRLGTALLQVCQPREPCMKVDRFHNCPSKKSLKTYLIKSAFTGWFYRILEEGTVTVGQDNEIEFVSRVHPQWPVANIVQNIHTTKKNSNTAPEYLKSVAELDELAYEPYKKRAVTWLAEQTQK